MAQTLMNTFHEDGSLPRLRVLVADDDEINRRVLVHILVGLNHEVKVASSGLEALKALATGSFDVVFMDLHMPDMGGLDATRLIVNTWNPESRPRIVGLTADSKDGIREKCLAAGMSGFLSKPAGIGSVRAALKTMTRRPETLPASRPCAC